ncbi:sushi domain-containing protein 6-like isoform X3 [Cyprinus carpio]|uniref:Sushi domain containing 6 n=2 Tax=Cyprinus carpio TaxID=7962 RepID=A0A9J7X5F5_CYPCA|nr:sushi domain-containing protein 6-like isoform X3 [Cyprinus carpio]
MCNGMVACETRASLAHRVAATSLLLLLLGVLPTGQASGCSRPSVVPHGHGNLTETNRGSFSVGTLLQYSCDPGYSLDGYSIITCTVSGHWSSDPPRCVKNDVCQPPSEPENGGYNCHPSPCHKLTQGTVIEYFCDEGYILKGGYHFRTCDNGEWKSPMQISCHSVQGEEQQSQLPMPALSIVASTASSVVLILLLVVLFVLLQPKLKSFHHSRSREQGVSGQPTSIMVEGVQVSLPSYEEAVYGAGGSSVPPPESRVQIVLSEGPQAEGLNEPFEQAQVLSSSSSSSPSWAAEQPGAAAPLHRRQSSESSDQHSLLSVTSPEDYGDDIPLLKEA